MRHESKGLDKRESSARALIDQLKSLAKSRGLRDPDEIYAEAGEKREKELPHWVNKGSS